MRIHLLLLTLSLAAITTYAQDDLSGSRQASVFTYVYRIDPQQARALFRNEMQGWDKIIRTPVDSFRTDTQQPDDLRLPPADYIFAYARGSRLYASLQTIGPLRYDLLSSGRNAALSLHTAAGQPITDAVVRIGHRQIRFDAHTNSYQLGSWRNTRVTNIVENGALYYFSIESKPYPYYYHAPRNWWQIAHATLRTRYYRLRYLFRPKRDRSYFVFSKPKYKPRDSVRFKTFIMTSVGRPIHAPLQIRLRDVYGQRVDTVIGHIIPYRPGAYTYSFVLNDSFGLALDADYRVSLENVHGKEVAGENFHYEDYTMTSLRLEARIDKRFNSPGDPVSLYVKAIDENDLPVPDGRVRVLVFPSGSTTAFHQPHVFIPNILWTHLQPLDPVGETRIILPDSIFPPASFSYSVHVALLSSDNQYREQQFDEEYRDDTGRVFIQPHDDSIRVDYRVSGHSRPAQASVRAIGPNGGLLTRQLLTLPVTLRASPFASEYEVSVLAGPDSITEAWTCLEYKPTLSLASGRTRDSISFLVDNPQHLFFWYTVHAGHRVLVQGYTDSLFYQAEAVTPAPYSITIQYRWAGRIQKDDYPLPFRERLLRVQVHQPAFVYPGERTTIAIDVKDSRGRPVPDADVTAWSYTAKFNISRVPGDLPYFGKQYRSPLPYSYSLPDNNSAEDDIAIDWRRWSRAMALDTIEFYKFLNPATFYINREPTPDQKTQLAPFVSRKGQPEAVHLLYIDERPVYFSRTDQYPSYSFSIEPGLHSLRLRTATSEIRLDTIRISKGVKTFLGINDDTADHAIHRQPMPDTLTATEQQMLRHSLIGLQNNFGYRYALITQGADRYFLFNTGNIDRPSGVFLAGPLSDATSSLRVEDGFQQPFDPESSYRFTITKGLIKERETSFSSALRDRLGSDPVAAIRLGDRAMTSFIADSLWQDYLDVRSQTTDFIMNPRLQADGNGLLQFDLCNPDHPSMIAPLFVKKVFLFRYDYPDYMRVYSGQTRNLSYLEPGLYHLFLLLKSQRYLSLDSIRIRPDGLNYCRFPAANIHEADSFSRRISALLKQQEDHWTNGNSPELEPMQSTFNQQYLIPASFSRQVTGRVLDQAGHGLVGASVLLKGTRFGTATNSDGYFNLVTTNGGTLVFAAVGFNTQQIALHQPYVFEVHMNPSSLALRDVVVTGYGVSRKRDLTGSFSMVTGNGLAGNASGVMIRGQGSIAGAQPLIMVDGLPYSGKVADLDPNSIESVSVLSAKDATPIYGSNGAAGVILVTTRKEAILQPGSAVQPGNSLRRHFRDDAWWQASLRTDRDGSVSFPVEFPDDITNWQTFVIAATGHRQIGLVEGNIRSFKAISAGIYVPAFLVEGDSARVIGKMLNYMPDSASVTRSFSVNGLKIATGDYRFRNAHLDSFLIHPFPSMYRPDTLIAFVLPDTMHLRYTLRESNGYYDGEERAIPVYPAGARETKGNFLALEGDTMIRLHFDTTLGPVHLFASASILPVLLDEIGHIERYEYSCNEQLASKLKAVLEKKRILDLLHQRFRQDDLITQLIAQLMKNRKAGLWGWWPEDEPSAWITLHVAEALLEAENAGYPTGLEKAPLIEYLIYRLENNGSEWDRLFILRILQELHAKVDYQRYINDAERNVDHADWLETLRLMEIRQSAGMKIRLDTLMPKRSYTALGSCYWGKDNGGLWNSSVQYTLLMYHLLRSDGDYDTLLPKIRNYFLELRGPGYWRNTYESSLILETLLPDLLKNGAPLTPPSLHLQRSDAPDGAVASNVTTFPFTAQCPATSTLDVRKRGSLPVYFTAWQQYWNRKPEKVDGAFIVHSYFESNGRTVTRLTAGEIVTFGIDVDAKGDADYVMIEVPIPAGCTYYNKSQYNENQEVHREYLQNKLSIFCGHITKGVHHFQVTLLPRFSGDYRLNPARAELMYFPVLFGRTAIRSVTIE